MNGERAMCPMCIGTADLVLTGSGAAGGAALAVGYLVWKKARVPPFSGAAPVAKNQLVITLRVTPEIIPDPVPGAVR
jgi:hypothetical protein